MRKLILKYQHQLQEDRSPLVVDDRGNLVKPAKFKNYLNQVKQLKVKKHLHPVPSFKQTLDQFSNRVPQTRRRSEVKLRKPPKYYHQPLVTKSFGGRLIEDKMSQLLNVVNRVDDTIDAVFTLIVPG